MPGVTHCKNAHPVSDKNPNVATPSDDLHPHAMDELLLPCHVPRGHDQDTLGQFQEVPLRWPPHLQVLEVFQDVP